jgi:hypothetical protein
MQAELGSVIELKGKAYRIVRLVDRSFTLVQRSDGQEVIIEESYIQLKGADNSVEFVQLTKAERAYEGLPQPIKPLEPIVNIAYPKGDNNADSHTNG